MAGVCKSHPLREGWLCSYYPSVRFFCAAASAETAGEASARLRLTHDLTREITAKFGAEDFSKYAPLTLVQQMPKNDDGESSSYYSGKDPLGTFQIDFSARRTIYKVWEYGYEIRYINTENSQACVTVGDIVPYAEARHWTRKAQWSDPVDFHIRMDRKGVAMIIDGLANLPFPEPGGAPVERLSPDADLSAYCVRTLSFRY